MGFFSTTVARRAALAIMFSAVAVAGASAQSQRSIRFASMDTNGDGVITRKEWNGSDRSFRVHDWNGDGILSGDEVRPGARRPNANEDEFDYAEREYPFDDWTARGFSTLDHNNDNRITRDEWHFDVETFRRADNNRDGVLLRAEFLGENDQDDDRGDRFDYLDANNDGRISRTEWHGTAERFDALDDNRDGMLTRAEAHERLGIQNIGDIERVARTTGGLALVAVAGSSPVALRWPLRLIGLYGALTGISGWCPAYHAAGVTSLGGPGDRPDEAERSAWIVPRALIAGDPPAEGAAES